MIDEHQRDYNQEANTIKKYQKNGYEYGVAEAEGPESVLSEKQVFVSKDGKSVGIRATLDNSEEQLILDSFKFN